MFKVGDIIKGKENKYLVSNEYMTKAKVVANDGKNMVIEVLEHKLFGDSIKGRRYTVDNNEFEFELVKNNSLLRNDIKKSNKSDKPRVFTVRIIDNKVKVIAEDGTNAMARCCPEDDFNLKVGLDLALDRLFEKEEEKKIKYLNCKFVCVDNLYDMTVGKIYEVKDGKFKNDKGDIYPTFGTLKTEKQLIDFMDNKIVIIKED